MYIGEVIYKYMYNNAYVGGRIVIKEYTKGTLTKTSKEVDFSVEDLDHLEIANITIDKTKARTIEVFAKENGYLYNPYGDAPSMDVGVLLKELQFREAEFYDYTTQVYEQELAPKLQKLLKGRRLFIGSTNIQLAPAKVLNGNPVDSEYIAVSISKRVPVESRVMEVLKALYYTMEKYSVDNSYLLDIQNILSYDYNVTIKPSKQILGENQVKYTCVSCKKSVISEYVVARCPDCLSPTTTKEGILNAW